LFQAGNVSRPAEHLGDPGSALSSLLITLRDQVRRCSYLAKVAAALELGKVVPPPRSDSRRSLIDIHVSLMIKASLPVERLINLISY
jgi:hypothetical protein